MMIVVHHSIGHFGISDIGVNLGQGVSFFFVLSGFILTHVYPELRSRQAVGAFWRARVARIWPAHAACFVIGFVLIPYTWHTSTALANLLLVQAWIPVSRFYFSYNAVSWTISTEMFFYAVFPLLVLRWERTWGTKLAVAAVAVVALILISATLPHYGNPGIGTDGLLITQHGLLYVSPLARMFEFVFGMCIALAWRKTRRCRVEAVCGNLTGARDCGALRAVDGLPDVDRYLGSREPQGDRPSPSGSLRADRCSHSGRLIYVIARGEGHVSALLAAPLLVFLGEISYSIYLLHQILLYVYSAHAVPLAGVPNAAAFCIFLLVMLLASYVLWAWVEMPGRQLILGRLQIHSTPGMRRSWRALGVSRPLLAAVALVGVLASLRMAVPADANPPQEAVAPAGAILRTVAENTRFGDQFLLDRLDLSCARDPLRVEMAWRRTIPDTTPYTIAVHLTDGTGTILDKFDFRSKEQARRPDAGHAWSDALVIPSARIPATATTLAIGIYDDSMRLLAVKHGRTDWGGRRLLVPLAPCAAEGGTPSPAFPPEALKPE